MSLRFLRSRQIEQLALMPLRQKLTWVVRCVQRSNRPSVPRQQPRGVSLSAEPGINLAALATVPHGDDRALLPSTTAAAAFFLPRDEDETASCGHHKNIYLEGAPDSPLAGEVFRTPKLRHARHK